MTGAYAASVDQRGKIHGCVLPGTLVGEPMCSEPRQSQYSMSGNTLSGVDSRISVFFSPGITYHEKLLTRKIGELLETIIPDLPRQTKVLVKPNLLTGKKKLATTHPLVVKGVVAYLLDCSASVLVGDSPAFGSAEKVSRKNGLTAALGRLPVKLISLDAPRKTRLPCGVSVGLSRQALDSELILNIPKLKAHGQFLVTGAVKNLFGCVVGARKALAHYRHGHVSSLFHQMLIEILQVLPKTVSIMDAITVMSGTGPIDGTAAKLSLLGASENPVALDTAVYTALGLCPTDVVIWQEALAKGVAGSDPGLIDYPLALPGDIDVSRFSLPATLKPVTFHPVRLAKGRLKSLIARFV